MSTVAWAILISSLIATVIFIVGFARGLRAALDNFRKPNDGGVVGSNARIGAIILSTAASGVVIASIGYSPALIYAGPFLVIIATAVIGIAFLIEDRLEDE